ncbi:MAG: hypothetical protein K0U33_05330 [Bacteroidetes bacterium]|nr:hypothetical protein [Bacteroidota bacterium]
MVRILEVDSFSPNKVILFLSEGMSVISKEPLLFIPEKSGRILTSELVEPYLFQK